MKSITKQKPFEEIKGQLDGLDRVFIVGCGTCTTMTKTGGRDEVLAMKEKLQEQGKIVTG
ncbi:MAG: 5,10-methylenetetrahydrofolate reductase, partial [Chloroflexi bacterium]|nr:5,10-methylenetetrahydrofolate reductase [Chloroflexota bacterium]